MWLRSPLLPGSPLAQHMLPISKEESRSPPTRPYSLFSPRLFPSSLPSIPCMKPPGSQPPVPARAGLG